MRAPWFKFFADEWLGNRRIRFMTAEQRGYLIQLSAEAWVSTPRGTLPADPEQLWRLAGAESKETFAASSQAVLDLLQREGDTFCFPMLCEQAGELEQFVASRSRAGRASAAKRKEQNGNTCSTRVERVNQQNRRDQTRPEAKQKTDLRASHARVSQKRPNSQAWAEQNSFAYRQFCRELTTRAESSVGMSDASYKALVLRVAKMSGVPDRIALELEGLTA